MGAASPWNAGKSLIPPPPPGARQFTSPPPITVSTVGDTEITVPLGVKQMDVALIGAGGSGGRGSKTSYPFYTDEDSGGGGGGGALVNVTLDVTQGEKFLVRVGRGGDGPGGDTSIIRSGIVLATAGGGRPGTTGEPGRGGAGGIPVVNKDIPFSFRREEKGRNGTDGVGGTQGGVGGGFGTLDAAGATATQGAESGRVQGGGGGGGSSEWRYGGPGMSGAVRITWV